MAPLEPVTASEAGPIVFIVDDDRAIRESTARLIASVGLRAIPFANAMQFLEARRPEVPSCLVLDVRMPGLSGMDLQRDLAAADLRIPIVFITGHGDVRMSVEAMKAGAVEFLTKPFRDQELLDAVQKAIELDRVERVRRGEHNDLQRRFQSLSSGEREVLIRVVRGLLNKQIAAELGVSEITVKVRRARVMRKMSAESVADLVRSGERLGLRPEAP